MIKKLKGKWLSLFAVSIVLTSSCNLEGIVDEDISGLTVSPTIAIPLGFGEVSISDLLTDADSAFIRVYKDGANKDVLYLYYEQTLESQDLSDFIELPNKTVTRSFNINPTAFPVPVGASATPQTIPGGYGDQALEFDLALDPEKVTRVLFTAGYLRISAVTVPITPGLEFEATIELPTFEKNGTPLQRTFDVPTGAPIEILMDGYEANMDDNVFDAAFNVVIKPTAGGTIPPNTRFDLNLEFGGLDYDYIYGFFGNQEVELPDETLEIGAFENLFEDVEVTLSAPAISFDVVSRYGIPVTVNFNSLEARKSGSAPLAVTLSESPIEVASPAALGDSAVKTVRVTNAEALLDFAPTEFFYSVNAEINKGLATASNFIDKSSDLKVRMKVEVPFIGSASNIELGDTLDIDLGDLGGSEIESAALKIKATNWLPIDATLQIYVLRDNLTVEAILLEDNQSFLVGSETDGNGTPIAPGVVDDEIVVNKENLEKLLNAKKIAFIARVQTSDAPKNVKFRTTDTISLMLGLKVKGKINVDLGSN